MKCAAFCLGVRSFVSPPIGEALTLNALEGFDYTLAIGHAKFGAFVVAEIEFTEVTL